MIPGKIQKCQKCNVTNRGIAHMQIHHECAIKFSYTLWHTGDLAVQTQTGHKIMFEMRKKLPKAGCTPSPAFPSQAATM